MQAEALAAIFGEMATKHDLDLLRMELRTELKSLRSEQTAALSAIRTEMASIRTEMVSIKADLTWRFVALTVFLATVVSLVGFFAG